MGSAAPVTEPSQLTVLPVVAVSRLGQTETNGSPARADTFTGLLLTADAVAGHGLPDPCARLGARGCVRVNGRGKRLPAEPEGESVSRLARIAEIPAGSWTKWLVVGLWLVVVAVAFPLSGKLMGA